MMFLPLLVIFSLIAGVSAHGYMQDPPGRNAMFKYGFPGAPENWNLNENFCGGVGVQFNKDNKGRCGICGDRYDQKSPRDHEVGGLMYDGRIVATYKKGQVVTVKVHLTTNHEGWFQWKLCASEKNPTKEVTQECLDQNIVEVVGRNDKKFHVYYKDGKDKVFSVKLKLPDSLTCKRCVLQWRYHVGNSWGCDRPEDCGMGKGDQEEFINCSDIAIQ